MSTVKLGFWGNVVLVVSVIVAAALGIALGALIQSWLPA